jgi:hypothetical protein
MLILDSYLRAVKRYLPRSQSTDIIKELSDELRSQMEEKESSIGRAMSDEEIAVFLRQYGDPMTVARRYRQDSPSLTIGIELIGPELFPMYLIILGSTLILSIACTLSVLLVIHAHVTIEVFYIPVLSQIFCQTLVFIVLNFIRRKYPQPWYYPPAEMTPLIPIPRGYSIAGLILWVPVLLWWLAIPHFPSLILGRSADHLRLSPEWHSFYVPMLFLILGSVSQRAISLLRPRWTWFVPFMRFVVNTAAVFVLYFLVFKNHTLVVVADAFAGNAQFEKAASEVNNNIRWGILGPWLWFYAGISAPVYAWYCLPHLRRWLRSKRTEVSPASQNAGK